jgi:hypothetical protein
MKCLEAMPLSQQRAVLDRQISVLVEAISKFEAYSLIVQCDRNLSEVLLLRLIEAVQQRGENGQHDAVSLESVWLRSKALCPSSFAIIQAYILHSQTIFVRCSGKYIVAHIIFYFRSLLYSLVPQLREDILLEFNRALESCHVAPERGTTIGTRRRSRFSAIESDSSFGNTENSKIGVADMREREELMLFRLEMACRLVQTSC